MTRALDQIISPAAAVEKLCAMGVEVSERTLREQSWGKIGELAVPRWWFRAENVRLFAIKSTG